jgi:hypothetical protein
MKKINFIALFIFSFLSFVSVDNLMANMAHMQQHNRVNNANRVIQQNRGLHNTQGPLHKPIGTRQKICNWAITAENHIDIQGQGRNLIKQKIYLRGIQAKFCPPGSCGHHLSRTHLNGNDEKNRFKFKHR